MAPLAAAPLAFSMASLPAVTEPYRVPGRESRAPGAHEQPPCERRGRSAAGRGSGQPRCPPRVIVGPPFPPARAEGTDPALLFKGPGSGAGSRGSPRGLLPEGRAGGGAEPGGTGAGPVLRGTPGEAGAGGSRGCPARPGPARSRSAARGPVVASRLPPERRGSAPARRGGRGRALPPPGWTLTTTRSRCGAAGRAG